MRKKKAKLMTGEEFDALPAAEKERIFQGLDRETPEHRRARSTVPAPDEQAMLSRLHKKLNRGRPKVGRGAKVVSISVEAGLLREADAFARKSGIGRTELFVLALRGLLKAS